MTAGGRRDRDSNRDPLTIIYPSHCPVVHSYFNRPQDVESQHKNISGERVSFPDWEESDLSFQDNDYELSQVTHALTYLGCVCEICRFLAG
jgi:hypothetical protein